MVPYVLFGIAHYLVSLILDGKSLLTLIHIFTCNTQGLTIAGALWFLTTLFFTDILYFFLDQLRKKWLIVILVIIGSYADQILP